MSHSYSTAFSYAVLAGTGIWCLKRYGLGTLRFPHGTFSLIITHSLIGIFRWGNPDHGDSVDGVYQTTRFLQTIFALPCITTELYLIYNYRPEIALLHVGFALIPLIQFISNRTRRDVVDTLLVLNIISTGVLSIIYENYYGIALAVSCAINHFCIKDESNLFSENPNYDLHNYGLCFCVYFALKSLQD